MEAERAEIPHQFETRGLTIDLYGRVLPDLVELGQEEGHENDDGARQGV